MIRSIQKAFDVLEYLAGCDSGEGEGGATLTALAARLGDRPSTARNILRTLEECGYVARGEGRRYLLGPRCATLTQWGMAGRWRRAGAEALKTLADETGEAAVMTALVDGERRVLCRSAGGGLVSIDTGRIDEKPFWTLVTARAMAAHAPAEAVHRIVERHGLPGKHWDGIRSRRTLYAALAAVRKAGHAADIAGPDIGGLALGFAGPDGATGAVGLYFPIYRFDKTKRTAWLVAMKRVARRIAT